jgi:hypothetical protein
MHLTVLACDLDGTPAENGEVASRSLGRAAAGTVRDGERPL